MKFCPNCGTECQDQAVFCPNCGYNFQQGTVQNAVDPTDHTAEFDPKDISDNKVICMLIYLMGAIGIIIGLLAASSSKYVAFHIRQALKFLVVDALLALIAVIGAVLVIVPFIAGICVLIVFVLQIIAFFQICQGKAKEPAIISKLGFLK